MYATFAVQIQTNGRDYFKHPQRTADRPGSVLRMVHLGQEPRKRTGGVAL